MKKISSILRGNKGQDSQRDQTASASELNIVNTGIKDSIDMDEDLVKKDVELTHLEFVQDLDSPDAQKDELIAKTANALGDARDADQNERTMQLWSALKQYPKAAFWSVFISTTLIMEGYDTALLNSLFALPIFQQKFGDLTAKGTYEITAKWQIGLNMCISVGEIIGLQITFHVIEFLGNRWTMIIALFLLFVFNFLLFFCKDLAMIAVGLILSGLPWGAFQSLAVSYASEICPLALRYYLTTYVNMCWLFGQIFAAGILKNSQEHLSNSDMGYKLPFALQWIWPVPLAIGIFLAPESPWWLMKRNRVADAKKSLSRLSSLEKEEKEISVNAMVEKIRITIEKEELEKENEGSYKECFKGVNGRRTRIACLTWVAQNLSGSALLGYSTYFLQKAGLSTNLAFTFNIIQSCLGLAGTLTSWFISGYFGRFTMMAGGLTMQVIVLFIIGGLGFSSSSQASMAIGSLLIILAFFYNIGIGPVVYCIVSEIPSSRLRTQTVALARNVYNLAAIVNAIWTPYMLNTDDWNWGAKTGLFWGGFAAVWLAWCVLELPETSGRTFGELDELFAQGIHSRKFKYTKVDPFAIHLAEELATKEKRVNHDDASIEENINSLETSNAQLKL